MENDKWSHVFAGVTATTVCSRVSQLNGVKEKSRTPAGGSNCVNNESASEELQSLPPAAFPSGRYGSAPKWLFGL